MPEVFWDEVEDEAFDLVPDDTYPVRVKSVSEKRVGQGVVWDLVLEIRSGPHEGKRISDALLWFGNGLKRTKAALSGMGFDLKGAQDWHPSNLTGWPGFAEVEQRTRTWNGKEITESKPTYRGYSPDADAEWKPQTKPGGKVDGLPEDAPF